MIEQKDKTLCHISLGTNKFAAATAFYDKVLATLEIARVAEHENAVAYGKGYPTFWLQLPFDQKPATIGNGSHIGFMATSKEQVDQFYRVAIACGATCNGKPGARPDYGEPYYGCFVIDLDGHRIEASFWDMDFDKK